MNIYVSGAEQLPYRFEGIVSEVDYKAIRQALPTGDYVTNPFSDEVEGRECAVVERKTLSDLYRTASHGRDRFERELERMKTFSVRALVIEAEWSQILNPNEHLDHETKMSPASMWGSLIAWQVRYGITICCLPNRQTAERMTFRILERWHRDNTVSKKQARKDRVKAGRRSTVV